MEVPFWVEIFDRFHDRALAATDLEPLRNTELPSGEKEVRIWFSSLGSPSTMYRIIKPDGGVHGELIFYWRTDVRDDPPGETSHDFTIHTHAGRCDDFRQTRGRGTCRGLFARQPDWQAVYEQAVSAGLWTLPDQQTLGERTWMTMDGWGMVVELRDGDRFRSYYYNNPDLWKDLPENRKAIEIAETFRALYDALERPDSEKFYRGVVPSHLSNVLWPCGSGKTFVLGMWLFETAMYSDFPLPLPGPGGLEVEMIAIEMPEWTIRDRGLPPGEGLLQQMRLQSVRPASSQGCSEKL